MTRKKIFLIVQAVLCALIAGLLAAAALRLYFSGTGNQAGELFDHIYTREKAGAALLPVLPLFLVSLAMTGEKCLMARRVQVLSLRSGQMR